MTTQKEDLDAYVRRQVADTLASVLLELADAHPEVRQRLVRLQLSDRPDRLAASFRKTLIGWRRLRGFLDYRAARHWGVELDAWLTQVEHELLPRDPMAAVTLAEDFIESDTAFFERADDSDGLVGDAIRSACRLWLRAAARCEAPPDSWPDRIGRLFTADAYGAREPLLTDAVIVLSEPQLRGLVAQFEGRLEAALAHAGPGLHPTTGVRSHSAALTLLSRALGDPDVHVRTTLRLSPKPNSMQQQDFVLAYLDADRPADALSWVEDTSDWHELTRLRLLAEVLKRLGQVERSAPIQQQVFEQTLAVDDFRTWLGHLAPSLQPTAFARARELALDHDDAVLAARMLVEMERDEDAERVLLAEPARIRGQDYSWLVPLARALEAHARWRGATAVYRALLDAILAKAYAPAYGHGARYWHRLQAIAEQAPGLSPLLPHDDYIAAIRAKHARKVAFWAQVGKASVASEEGSDDDPDGGRGEIYGA